MAKPRKPPPAVVFQDKGGKTRVFNVSCCPVVTYGMVELHRHKGTLEEISSGQWESDDGKA